jgi:hypothetical protein
MRISSLCLFQPGPALRLLADDFCPRFVFQLLPLSAFNFCPHAAFAKAGFFIEFADADARRLNSHMKIQCMKGGSRNQADRTNLARCVPAGQSILSMISIGKPPLRQPGSGC